MILLLGGTTEARLLLERLADEGLPVIFSTAYEFAGEFIASPAAKNPPVKHIAGKLDVDELAALIDREKVALVIDATHPFATGVTENARAACEKAGVSYIRVGRPATEHIDYENIEYVDSMEEAALMAEGLAKGQAQGLGETIFLATGSNHAGLFSRRLGVSDTRSLPQRGLLGGRALTQRVYIRVLPGEEPVAKCLAAGFEREQIITGVGPFSIEENEELWKRLGVTVVVTKESGREGGFPEKVEAAKRLGIALVVVRRPGEADNKAACGVEVDTVGEGVYEADGHGSDDADRTCCGDAGAVVIDEVISVVKRCYAEMRGQ